MMRTILATALLLLAVLSGMQSNTTAEDGGRLIINEVMYDPPGDEVNGEWIEILVVEGDANLGNWTLSDLDGHIFTLPPLFVPALTFVVIRVGKGIDELDTEDSRITLYMNFSQPLLNNNGDELLLDSGGAVFDFLAYGPNSLVHYPPLDIHWNGRDLTSRKNQSLSLFPNGKVSDEPQDWFSLLPTPGFSNGNFQKGEDTILLTEAYYNNLRDNEYFCIENSGNEAINLTGWIVTDLEGEISFPADSLIDASQRRCITHNSTSYFEDVLMEADFTYGQGDARQMLPCGGNLALRNDGDEIVLTTQDGREIDSLIWGDSEAQLLGWQGRPALVTAKGSIAERLRDGGRAKDTNTSCDWESPRQRGIGQSGFGIKSFNVNSSVISYYSPGTSLGAAREHFGKATKNILLNAYQFTSKPIHDELAAAALRGVRVRILLEGQPVGGINSREIWLLENLFSLGVEVRFLMNIPDHDIFKRYAYNHAKYAVVDNRSLLISSENWGNNGYPENGKGNRGWGAIVVDKALATHFATIFFEDWNPLRRDSVELSHAIDHLKTHDEEEASLRYEPLFLDILTVSEDMKVTAVLGPDNTLASETILGLIDSALKSIHVEQFYIHKTWKVGDSRIPNPFLEGLVRAAERGCEVKVLLDPSWYNVLQDDPNDNDDTVEFLNSLANNRSINLEAKLMSLATHQVLKLHNKGLIVDWNRVLLSSINWNYNSFARNREAGLIIESNEIGAYFEQIFIWDWKDDTVAPVARIDGNPIAKVGDVVKLSALSSFDDNEIVRFSWDTDSDGTEDSNASTITVACDRTGIFPIKLEVEDGWGNSNTTTFMLVVENREASVPTGIYVLLALASGVAFGVSIYHIRKRRTKDI